MRGWPFYRRSQAPFTAPTAGYRGAGDVPNKASKTEAGPEDPVAVSDGEATGSATHSAALAALDAATQAVMGRRRRRTLCCVAAVVAAIMLLNVGVSRVTPFGLGWVWIRA
jgi:hypothetical protein